MSSDSNKKTFLQKIKPFIVGGMGGMSATCVIQPIDMVKVRIQLKSEKLGKGAKVSPFAIISEMIKKDRSIKQFYRGLDSALVRQITYTTTRMGLYKSLINQYEHTHKNSVPLLTKSLYGMFSGFVGSIVGNPSDLILVRLQADQTLPKEQRRHYKNFFDAFKRIIKEEGVLTLWRGSGPTIVRAMMLNLGMLGPFTEVKERLNKHYGAEQKDSLKIRIMAASISGFLSAFFSLPFDNAKTKMYKMVKGADGQYPYRNIFHAIYKSQQQEGFVKLWVGFPTYYVRIAPHAMLTWIFIEYVSDFINKLSNK